MKLTLIKKIDEAKGTKSFLWQPENSVTFLPGQYFNFTLPKLNYPDERGTTRHFTISSSPTEGNLLRLTTRIRQESGYKKSLDELPIGSEIEGQGPNGTFLFDEKETGPHIFLAGGIGIAPFRSMIKYNIDNNLQIRMYLIYSNSDGQFVFKDELDEWQKDNGFVKISYADTSVSGHLDQLKISQIIEKWKMKIGKLTWWMVGPPPFIDAMETILSGMKIPSDKILTEKFSGY